MSKDLAYYRSLPYEREWLPRDDESGRYFVVRLKDMPETYGMGITKQAALAAFRHAFDDLITWCLEEGQHIPEPSTPPRAEPTTIEIQVERIALVAGAQSAAMTPTRVAEDTESYRAIAVDARELDRAAA
jgi:predicted RNase H-like HicB family nuclease